MAVTEVVRDLTNLFNYSTDENPTSQQDYQEAVKNWVNTIINLVDCTMWQPNTEYEVGNVLRTPSLPLQLQLTCTTAGTTGSAEPDYSEVEAGDTVTDGTAVFLIDTVVSDGTMVAEAIKALASTNDVPSGITFPSTSLLSKMISNMNTQDGVQYNLSNANSWYICLGAKYGGLIIQGGTASNVRANEWEEFSFPISFPQNVVEHLVSALSRNTTVAVTGAATGHSSKTYFQVANSQANGLTRWLAIGY